jgi:hypothetical protein
MRAAVRVGALSTARILRRHVREITPEIRDRARNIDDHIAIVPKAGPLIPPGRFAAGIASRDRR